MFTRQLTPSLFRKIDPRLTRELNRNSNKSELQIVVEVAPQGEASCPGLLKQISSELLNTGLKVDNSSHRPSNYLKVTGTTEQILSALKRPDIIQAWAANTLNKKPQHQMKLQATPV